MTTLASAVSIGDNQLLIDTPLAAGQVPGWVKIDSEMLNVGGQHFRTGTTLVLSEPAKAAHSQGATVTYAGRPFDPTFVAATAGEGGAAEAGTVVVTPPLEVDVGAALEGANAPSGGNPLATIADLNVQVVSRHLTSAEILALFTTPIELVAGVPGQFHVPVFAVAVYKVGTTPYTLNQTTFLNVSAIPTTMIAIANTFFLDQADDTVTMIAGLPNGIAPALATVEGAALSIWIDTVNPTDGDGTVDLTLLYHTIDVTP